MFCRFLQARTKMSLPLQSAGFLIAVAIGATLPAHAQLRVGTGKVDITPAAKSMPAPFTSVRDHIFTRAIMLENGKSKALLMNGDLAAISDGFFKKVIADISQREDIPSANILVSATHAHNTPSAGNEAPRDSQHGPPPLASQYTDMVEKAMIEAADQAKASLQPAEVGFGEGRAYLNASRDAIDPKTRKWAQEPNLDYPSDKTLAVVEFRKPGGGDPIAIYFNYASHDMLFLTFHISGGFTGAAERYLEDNFDNKIVAIWTSGAAGDQNPEYMRIQNLIGKARIDQEMTKPDDPAGTEENAAISRLMFGMNKRPILPLDPKVLRQGWDLNDAMGQMMGEEVLRVMSEMQHFNANPAIRGTSTTLTCPGRDRIDRGREGEPGQYKDGAPVVIGLGAVTIGDIALPHVGAEVYNMIGQEVKSESPYRHTMFVTWTDGRANSGYIPTDDAFGRYTFQVLGTRLKPGCAERGIVNDVDDILYKDIDGPAAN